MTRHDPIMSLRDMLSHAREAVVMAHGRQRHDLDSNRMLNLALAHLVEIVGEAATRIPSADQDRWPEIPWASIVGLRNRLAHGYDQINLDILWTILQSDLPPLIAQMERILSAL